MTRLTGTVLTGGASRRMGRDKALLEVEGIPMARRVAAALAAAGASPVHAVGGDEHRLRALGFSVVADHHPGEGPLGGVLTSLEVASAPILVVAPCDQPWLDGPTVSALVSALEADPHAAAAVATVGLHRQVLPLALRTGSARRLLVEAFATGARSMAEGLSHLSVAEVGGLSPGPFRDVDRAEDLAWEQPWGREEGSGTIPTTDQEEPWTSPR